MADSANDTLTPEKTSTAAGLLTGVGSKFTSAYNSLKSTFVGGDSSAKTAGTTSSSSFLTNPIIWVVVLVAAGVVYFKKFRKPGRKAVKWRK